MTKTSVVKEAKRLATMTEAAARKALGSGVEADGDADYQGLDGLTEMTSPTFPGSVYVASGRVRLVYVPQEALEGVTPAAIAEEATGSGVSLRSRSGKKAKLHVHAAAGLAYASEGDTLHFLEAFPPCTQDEYESSVYEEPPPFKR